ncbi:uncharacterized protein LOC130771746 [Actinidia eriantha]|uniref:uncharacterized protein LOC130771746 n=1 Tax=Actinidia eriantha TaxID=165200 RepID=UPI00258373AB|nr:uncharacterized protein LOC130771746 [Actinidia eriantha]
MGDALFDLEQILRSKQENLTSQEANVLMTCKANAMREFTIGAAAGGCVSWLATRRLNNFFRFNLSALTAGLAAFWRFGRSIDSSLGHILSLDGSRMQMELANIMLRRYGNDPIIMQRVSKHFFPETVLDDSSPDQPKLRWRYRNYYGDSVAHSQSRESESYGDKTDSENTRMQNIDEPKRVFRNPGVDALINPFDCVFGTPGSSEEIHHHNTATTPPKRHSRSHKRSHRRHRLGHHEVPSNSQSS